MGSKINGEEGRRVTEGDGEYRKKKKVKIRVQEGKEGMGRDGRAWRRGNGRDGKGRKGNGRER